MAKVLVTGGAGFIGPNIVEELLKRGEKVKVSDNSSTDSHPNLASMSRTALASTLAFTSTSAGLGTRD